MSHTFQRSVRIARPSAEVFAWHEQPGAFARLQPPWERVEIERASGGVRDGARVALRAKAGPFWTRWEVEHRDYEQGVRFCDVQLSGPFASWHHEHLVVAEDGDGSTLRDTITYALPFGPLGALGAGYVQRKLSRLFAYRHEVTKDDLEESALLPPTSPMRVLVSGASGLVGSALEPLLTTQGHTVIKLVRGEARGQDEVSWDPARGELDLTKAGRIDAVVHLAGAGIADQRWSKERREVILRSRVDGTRTLVRALCALPQPPRVLVSASAVGFYGDTHAGIADEDSAAGKGFLADVCRAWEEAAAPALQAGVRTVWLRTGVVLTPAGGALARMLPPFVAGVGGRLGSGRQGMSWIALDDLLGVIHRALRDDRCHGPINAVAPEPCSNAVFTKTLGRVLHRPTVFPVPAAMLRLVFGDLANETLLADSRVRPARLQALGHRFRYPDLQRALAHVLGRTGEGSDA